MRDLPLWSLFAGISDKWVRRPRRRTAYWSMEVLIAGMTDEFDSAVNLLPSSATFDTGEHTFQAAARQQCLTHLPVERTEVWALSPEVTGSIPVGSTKPK
jgi:hypothetical protein